MSESFLKEVDVKESDLKMKKTLGDRKREYDRIQESWKNDKVPEIENKKSDYMIKNKDAMERLKLIQK